MTFDGLVVQPDGVRLLQSSQGAPCGDFVETIGDALGLCLSLFSFLTLFQL